LELTNIERICYLRFFLETEGVIFLKLAERFCKIGELSYKYLKDNIQDVFKEIYQEYIDIAPDFRTRIRIKETLRQMKAERYDETTLPHKIRPHLQALTDLRILSNQEKNGEIIFSPLSVGTTSSLAIIYSRLKNIQNMENMFLNHEYFPLIAELFGLTPARYTENHRDLLMETISYGYNVMRSGITRMADIDALIDWSCIKMLSEHNILIERQDVEDLFNRIRKEHPSNIQYHVDGKGRVAYLVFTEPI